MTIRLLLPPSSGKYRPGDESERGVTPDACVPDFSAAVEWVLQQNAAAAGT